MPAPFASDCDYLEAEFNLLACRVQRLAAERELRAADRRERAEAGSVGRSRHVADDDATRRHAVFSAREEQMSADLDARLQAHRSDPTAQRLGIDILAQTHGLGEEERLILLSALSYAVAEELAESIHSDLEAGGYGAPTVESLMRLLDAQSVADRVLLRRLFRPDGPLLKGGLVILDCYTKDAMPDDLLSSRIRLTSRAFGVLVGQNGTLRVVNP